ncbi:hypothetical protein DFH94DRAFT_769444 [Russula ochroleuca]|jgi:hypothetical protein|uniref:Uncharacterized protein n=1 Tax=Russula ochroleuca TaxID=152965 RepID=A0A9P5JZU1_9AGAM|nr:hypothetical protein DFH94DRAFT_769444 [Russula ochroleuca]
MVVFIGNGELLSIHIQAVGGTVLRLIIDHPAWQSCSRRRLHNSTLSQFPADLEVTCTSPPHHLALGRKSYLFSRSHRIRTKCQPPEDQTCPHHSPTPARPPIHSADLPVVQIAAPLPQSYPQHTSTSTSAQTHTPAPKRRPRPKRPYSAQRPRRSSSPSSSQACSSSYARASPRPSPMCHQASASPYKATRSCSARSYGRRAVGLALGHSLCSAWWRLAR